MSNDDHSTDGDMAEPGSSGPTPGVGAGRTGFQDWLHWLKPTMREEGRHGFLSTYEEVHVFFMGFLVGITINSGGLAKYLSALLGSGLAGSRYQKGLSDDIKTSIKRELPHFAAGVVVGYAIASVIRGDLL